MDQITQFVAYISVIAISAERLTDIIKRMYLANKEVSGVVYQLITFACGVLISLGQPLEIKFFNFNPYVIAVITGFAVSGTSSAWHDLLTMLSLYNKQIKLPSPTEVK